MDRRHFLLTSLAGALAAPLGTEAQPEKKLPRLCFLTFDPGTDLRSRYGAVEQIYSALPAPA
jgi:hypothetical protein